MKTSATILKRFSRFAFVGLLGLTMLSSCKKNDENDVGETAAKVNLINASTDAGPARLYVDGVLRTPSNVSFGNSSGYYGTFVGNQTVEIKSASGEATLGSTSAQLDGFGYYSFLLVGQNSSLGIVTVSDAAVAPASGKARIRFVNAVTNSGAMALTSGSAINITGVNFRGVSSSVEVTAGTYVLNTASGSTSTSFTTNLEAGKIYVIYAKGLVGATGANVLSLGVSGN